MGANTRGGEHFRAGRFSEAVKCYSGGIEADSEPFELAKLLANRSAAYGRLGNLEAALADGKRAVEIDPSYIKGYFRATKAHMALGQFRRASAVASEGLSRAPDNEELQQALQDANSEGANSPAPPSGRRAKRATTPASPPSTITPVVPAPAARTEGPPCRASGAHEMSKFTSFKSARFGEYLYAGNPMYDRDRRYVLTWGGKDNPTTDPDMRWEIVDFGDYVGIKSVKFDEWMYAGNPKLDSDRRHVLTYVTGDPKSDPDMRWIMDHHGAAGPPIAITAELEAVELKAQLADAETRAEERVP